MKSNLLKAIILSMAFLLVACKGSTTTSTSISSSPVAAITLPKSLSVVTVNETGSNPSAAHASNSVVLSIPKALTVASNTDYHTDEADVYVYDASMESLEMVNMILCMMGQTGASEMVNKGAYIALVNEDKCEQGDFQGSSDAAGQSSGSQVAEYSKWTILSTRESNNLPQVVKLWIPGDTPENGGQLDDPMDYQTILVEVTAYEGVSDTLPFGRFNMSFKGVMDAALLGGTPGVEITVMNGSLMTVSNEQGVPQFKFINLVGDALPGTASTGFSMVEAANVLLNDASGSGGVALTHFSETYFDGFTNVSEDESFAVEFNSANLLRGEDTNGDNVADITSCKARDDFDSQVWQYNLYHAADGMFNSRAVTKGQRVVLNSGYPFSYDGNNDGVNESYGWIGSHGLWSERRDIADGTSVTRFDYDSIASSVMTIHIAPGNLMRRTANSELLSTFQGYEFQYRNNHPVLGVNGQWIVTVDVNNDFQITGSISWGNNGPVISTTVDHDNNPATAEVSVVTALLPSNNEDMWLWSDGLGGDVIYVHDNSLASNSRTVTFYAQESVVADDASLFPGGTTSVTLYCYDQCLKGGLTQGDVDSAASKNDLYYSYAGTPFQFTLSISDNKVLLTDDSNGLMVSAASLDLTSLGHDWGINTGAMLTAPLANTAEPWSVYDAPLSYFFNTGKNYWNQKATVSNAQGVLDSFDRPLQFYYTHSTANDANGNSNHDGGRFLLEYGGPGNLWGIPEVEDSENDRWYSEITLANGLELSSNGKTFAVKAIETELSMRDDVGGCGLLSVDTLFTDPALSLPTAADIGTVSFSQSEKPAVTGAPAVIEGVVQ